MRAQAALSMLILAAGCGVRSGPASCVPGTSQACACPGGAGGVQTCDPSGTFDGCECPDAGPLLDASSGPDASVTDAASVDAFPSDEGDSGLATADSAAGACDIASLRDIFAWYIAEAGVTTRPTDGTTDWASQAGPAEPLNGRSEHLVAAAINGHPALDFTSASFQQMCATTCPSWPAGTPFYAAVVHLSSGPMSGTIFAHGLARSFYFMSPHASDDAYDWVLGDGRAMVTIPVNAALAPGSVPHLAEIWSDGAGATVSVDRSNAGTHAGIVEERLAPNGPIFVGAFRGMVAEVVVLIGPSIDATERDCVGQYLMTRYALAPH